MVVAQLIPARRDGGDPTGIVMETQYQLISDRSYTSLVSTDLVGGYTTQFPNKDSDGLWQSLPVTYVQSLNTVNVMATDLQPSRTYRFRCALVWPCVLGAYLEVGVGFRSGACLRVWVRSTRAIVPLGPSAWSSPSATITTLAGPPAAPVIQPVPQASIGAFNVSLQWVRGSSNGDPVFAYDVQYRAVGKADWREVRWCLRTCNCCPSWICCALTPQAITDLSAVLEDGVREIQTISSRCDPGFTISSGSFTIGFTEVGG